MLDKSQRHNNALCNLSSGFVFLCSLAAYWCTADSSVSYWDCPEYVVTASRLEVGHPPGNPIWTLAMRVATIPFSPEHHAYVINLCSGLFMALAAFFLARIIYIAADFLLRKQLTSHISGKCLTRKSVDLICTLSSAGGALCFAFCDSAWFSAVEAEVYAMSALLTALTIWLALVYAGEESMSRRRRLLILIAYITGLSLGVHQLNLLCIPAVALIYIFARHPEPGQGIRAWVALLLSFLAVGAILLGMMDGSLTICGQFELWAVNTLHLPYFSGVLAYAAITVAIFLTAIYAAGSWPRPAVAAITAAAIWLSGLTVFLGHIMAGGIAAAVVSSLILFPAADRGRLQTLLWMLGFILLGYSSFAMILIRGNASPPMNEGAPTDIFALHRYISRDQYGSKPLLRGATPFSRPLFQEEWIPGNDQPVYKRYALRKKSPIFVRSLDGARLHHRSGFIGSGDSAANRLALKRAPGSYLLSDYSFERITTPELDMWMPRITGSSQSMLDGYDSWLGMNKSSMHKTEVSAALDSLGNPVGRYDASGQRHKEISWRPTYLQNLEMLLSYQAGYMYFRYLMWNFAGRQNDIPSTGEIEHGNFITGLNPLDEAMLGPQSAMPPDAAGGNKGRNVYYCLPLLFGIVGIIYLACGDRRRRRILAVTAVFFLMTGLAIVVYLNQTPGEPRERDYSFLGSFMAFSIWIAIGVMAVSSAIFRMSGSRLPARIFLIVSSAGLPAMLLFENIDDHDRSGRYETASFAANILAMPDGIVFTHGDNFTFPLWYAKEVENKGSGHTVIDISYLSTPEYVANLMRQGDNAIRFIAKPADIAYGAYAFTRIAPDADTVAVALSRALRELYSVKTGAPVFRHSRVIIPGNGRDSLTINLRDITTGGFIPFRKLMLLDIIAANGDCLSPRPIYFLSHIPCDFYNAARGATLTMPFAEAYWPQADSSVYINAILDQTRIMINKGFGRKLPEYVEPVVADQHRRQRGALTRAGRVLFDNGLFEESRRCAEAAMKIHPPHIIAGESFTVADTTFHEGMELARLMIGLSDISGDRHLRKKAARMLIDMRKTALDWKRYYSALLPAKRAVVSNGSRRLILTIPTIDSLTRLATRPTITPKHSENQNSHKL